MSLIHEALRKAAEHGAAEGPVESRGARSGSGEGSGAEGSTAMSHAASRGLEHALIGPAPNRGWTGPAAVVGALVILLCIAVTLAVNYLTGQTKQATAGLAQVVRQTNVDHPPAATPDMEPVAPATIGRPQPAAPPAVAPSPAPITTTQATPSTPPTHAPLAPNAATNASPPPSLSETTPPIASPAPTATTSPIAQRPAIAADPPPTQPAEPVAPPLPAGPVLESGREYVKTLDVTDAPRLTLTGIAYSDTVRLAFINGITAEAGQSVEGVLVVKVERRRVLMAHEGKAFVLRMP